MHTILRRWHLMIGVDFHMPHPPPTGIPWPPSPYFVASAMSNSFGPETFVLYSPTVYADSGQSNMLRGSDIGPMIPHAGIPSLTIFIEMMLSSSKCHFGPSSVIVSDQHGGTGNPAAALAFNININLNCGFPIPTPGLVLAPNTTVVTLTLGDVVAGMYLMVLDFGLQSLVNMFSHFCLGPLFGWLGARLGAYLGIRPLSRAALRLKARANWKADGKVGPLSSYMTPALRNSPVTKFKKITDIFSEFVIAPIELVIEDMLSIDMSSSSNVAPTEAPHDASPAPLTWSAPDPIPCASQIPLALSDYYNDPAVEDILP